MADGFTFYLLHSAITHFTHLPCYPFYLTKPTYTIERIKLRTLKITEMKRVKHRMGIEDRHG